MISPLTGSLMPLTLPRRAAAAPAVDWWLSGGVSATNAIIVYQPKGAASLLASYTNLANPGTYNAAPGVAPTFDAAGWIFNGINQYLATGYTIVAPQSYTAIIRFSDALAGGGRWIFGAATSSFFGIQPIDDQAIPNVAYLSGSFRRVNPSLGGGVLAIAGNQGYRNGTADGPTITNAGNVSRALIIGGVNNSGVPGGFRSCKVQAFALYGTVLSAAQVAAVSAAAAAL